MRAEDGIAGTHHDEAGQILVLGAEAVGQPRAHGRTAGELVAAVHHEQRRLVIGTLGEHGADDAEVVGMASPSLAKISLISMPLLSVLAERERRLEQIAGLALGLEVPAGQRLAVELVEHRLGVEGVDLRRPAVEEKEDDVFGLGREVRRFGASGFMGGEGWRRRVSRRDRPCRSPSPWFGGASRGLNALL